MLRRILTEEKVDGVECACESEI